MEEGNAFFILDRGSGFLWAVTPLFALFVFPAEELAGSGPWERRGQFGDSFGAVTSLFSGLAFAGLFWALRVQTDQLELQRTELGLQREELKLQREEMAASRKELADQAKGQWALYQGTVAQVAVAAYQAKIEALRWDAYQWNEHGDARSRLAKPVREIADELMALHLDLSKRGAA